MPARLARACGAYTRAIQNDHVQGGANTRTSATVFRTYTETGARSAMGSTPSRSVSRASIVASLAGRTIDGAGNPATARSEMITSPGHARCVALVIIASQSRPCRLASSPAARMSAGRRCRTGRSVYGNGTLTISQTSKSAIGLGVGFRCPLVKGAEWILDRIAIALGQDHLLTLDPVRQHISLGEVQRLAYRSRNCRLGLARQSAPDHPPNVRNFLTAARHANG